MRTLITICFLGATPTLTLAASSAATPAKSPGPAVLAEVPRLPPVFPSPFFAHPDFKKLAVSARRAPTALDTLPLPVAPGQTLALEKMSQEPPSAAAFDRLVLSLLAYRPLEADHHIILDQVVARAKDLKDVTLLAQLALLSGKEQRALSELEGALEGLYRSNVLSYGKPGDYAIGLEAEKALLALDRHRHAPLGAVKGQDGKDVPARLWMAGRLREHYGALYAP